MQTEMSDKAIRNLFYLYNEANLTGKNTLEKYLHSHI